MNQIKVFLLCLKKGINLMFQTNINCYFKGRHSSSNFTNVLTYIFWISENIISKSVTSTNPMMRSYKYALCAVFLLLYVKIHTLEYLMSRVELMIVHNMVYYETKSYILFTTRFDEKIP